MVTGLHLLCLMKSVLDTCPDMAEMVFVYACYCGLNVRDVPFSHSKVTEFGQENMWSHGEALCFGPAWLEVPTGTSE